MSHESSVSYRSATSNAHLIGIEVLVIDGDAQVHAGIEQLLSEAQLHVTCVADLDRARELVERQFFSVALVDLDTPAPSAGLDAIRMIKRVSPTSMIIALTPRRSFDDAVDAVRAGAIDLILKAPESVAYLKDRVLDAATRSVGKREVDSVLDDVRGVHEEFLQRFMEAERRAIDLADKAAGRDPSRLSQFDELRVLVVDEVDDFVSAMTGADPKGFAFVHATSGGEGLDRISSGGFHYAMIAEDVTDLPARTLARTIRNQHPDTVVLTFLGPADNGRVELVETAGMRTLVQPFTDAKMLLDRLDELADAWRAKARERRYTQAFREKHYDFLRRYVELKTKIERAISDGA
ncbi:MAG: response regulator [Deltaproteobacteria bacterium]|nr:response regulator [Deltaproteobacteria bacterium]MCW5807833.1 response regulator [Deltaproteobacteria bacterium]